MELFIEKKIIKFIWTVQASAERAYSLAGDFFIRRFMAAVNF